MITKGLRFQLTVKTDLQYILYTTLPPATVKEVPIDNVHLFVAMLIPSAETKLYFNNCIKISCTL